MPTFNRRQSGFPLGRGGMGTSVEDRASDARRGRRDHKRRSMVGLSRIRLTLDLRQWSACPTSRQAATEHRGLTLPLLHSKGAQGRSEVAETEVALVHSGRGRSAASYSRLDVGAFVPVLQHDFGCDDPMFGGECSLGSSRAPRPRWRVCELIAGRAERFAPSATRSEGIWRSVNYRRSSA